MQHFMEHNGIFKIAAIFVAVLCYGRVVRSFFTGEILIAGQGRASRSESPGFYWSSVAFYVGIATFLLWAAFLHGRK